MRTRFLPRIIVTAALLFGGAAGTGMAVAHSPEEQSAATSRTTSERQHGLVLEGSAPGVMVFVYENSLHGNSVQVVLGDPDDDRIGYAEQAEPFVVEGVLSATVEIDGQPVTIDGTVSPGGRPTRIVEPMQDGGEQIVTRGTNTPLAVDASLTTAGSSVPLEFAPAFAYDLSVRRVTLYGR